MAAAVLPKLDRQELAECDRRTSWEIHHDPSANVRLAAIEALSPLVELPRIGSELLQTLQAMHEQDPQMVRVSLAELLLEAGVKGSDLAVRDLIEADDLDAGVKDHLQTVMRTSG